MLDYTEKMVAYSGLSPWCSVHGGDQGVHNYLLHSGLLHLGADLEQFEMMRSRIATLDSAVGLNFSGNGMLLNSNEEIFRIVHQVNRCINNKTVNYHSRWDCEVLERPSLRFSL